MLRHLAIHGPGFGHYRAEYGIAVMVVGGSSAAEEDVVSVGGFDAGAGGRLGWVGHGVGFLGKEAQDVLLFYCR